MIEETGVVVAVEQGAVWVETVKASTCGACKAKSGCGHHLLNETKSGQRARLRVLTKNAYQVGDTLTLGVPEGALVKGALWVYALPLVLLFLGALLGGVLVPANEPVQIAFALLGLTAGLLVNRRMSRSLSHHTVYSPTVLSSSDSYCEKIQVIQDTHEPS